VTIEGSDARPTAGALLEIHALQLGPIGTNCYVVHEAGANTCAVVDPGADHEVVLELLAAEGLTVDAILVTHCHWDHIGGVAGLAAATGAPVWMSETEAIALEHPDQFVFPGMPVVEPWRVDHRLAGGERIEVAGIALDVLLVPGHSPGHIAFVAPGMPDAAGDGLETPPVCFIGDVLFKGSVGRTDLPFADHATLVKSLGLLVRRLDPTTLMLSGHGEPTTMDAEIRTNPFLQGI
jgi:glyoxylase-like metal-dependent hydrolase (beta-lactamase superfamily II)